MSVKLGHFYFFSIKNDNLLLGYTSHLKHEVERTKIARESGKIQAQISGLVNENAKQKR